VDKRKYKLEMHRAALQIRTLIFVLLIPAIASAQLRISANGHYLYEKQTGQPVFLNGESVWCLFTAPTYAQADIFFQNCQQYGVIFLQTCLIEDGFTQTASGWGSPNTNGHRPFTTNSFTTPRESYFTHCDSIIGLAKRYGIYLHLYISYLGAGSYEGWQTEIGSSSIANMKSWGNFVGSRYKDSTNIVWGISGDCNPTSWVQKLDSMSNALMLVDTNHYLVPRDETGTTTSSHWPGRSWLKIDYIYEYWGPSWYAPEGIYSRAWDIYNSNRVGFMEEAWYENEHTSGGSTYPTNMQLRQQMYYGPLAGALGGQVFGNCPMWHFGKGFNSVCGGGTWQSWLDSPGHISLGWCGKLFRSRRWHILIPDQTGIVLTAGANTGANRAICANASDSTTIMVYLPSSRQVTVTSARLKGDSTHAWWFNPADGSTIDLGIQTKASHNYTPTSGDWLLVLDAKVMNYPAPGVESSAAPPLPPVLATPPNGAIGVQVNPTLTWNPSTGAISYRVQVSSDPNFATTVVDQGNITTTSYAVSGLATSTTYYWHVNATNLEGTSAYSTTRTFTTAAPPPPSPPSLSSPANGATGVSTSPTLTWNASAGATSYRLQVSTDAGFVTTVVDQSNITTTSYGVSGLATSTTYYWHVNATNSGGTSAYSTNRSFTTTAPPPPPSPPALALPANGATGVATNPTLRWNASAGATTYRLQLATDSTFSSPAIDDSTITDTSRQVGGLSTFTRYFWRVRARNAGGLSGWSPVWNFTTTVSLPTQVELVAPPDHAILPSDTAMFVWRRAAPQVSGYWLELATDSNFVSRAIDSTLTDTTKRVAGLLVNRPYWWRVRARNSAGWGPYSIARTFSVSTTSADVQAWPPVQFQLKQNYPNPFNPTTTIAFDLPAEADVSLIIHNVLGEAVRTLLNRHLPAGAYSLQWDGEDNSGLPLPSGIYICRIAASNRVVNIKMLLIR
jgi:hypothetical protein